MELLLVLLLAGGLYLGSQTKAAAKIDYSVKNIDISKGKLYLIIEFINPTYKSQSVDSINLKISTGKLLLGRIDYFETVNIPARNRTFIKVPVTVSVGVDLGTAIVKIYRGEIKELDITGSFLSKGFLIDVSKTVPLTA